MLEDVVPLKKGDTIMHTGANGLVGQVLPDACKPSASLCLCLHRLRSRLRDGGVAPRRLLLLRLRNHVILQWVLSDRLPGRHAAREQA